MTTLPIVQKSRGGDHLRHIRALLADADVVDCRGVVAFATLNGVLLLADKLSGGIRRFTARGGRLDWLIGIDAVTTGDALRALRLLMEEEPARVRIRTFTSQDGTLFHPKLLLFVRRDQSSTIIVGSSNLTKGGLIDNIEISVQTDLGAGETARWIGLLDDLGGTVSAVGSITDEVIAQLAARARLAPRLRRRGGPRTVLTEGEGDAALSMARVLVQLVPKAGRRASQLGIRADTMADFFGLRPGVSRKIRLQQVQPRQPPAPLEPLRPLVFPADSNRNSRIEVAGLKGVPITEASRPLAVFEQVSDSRFRYLILTPGDGGYRELRAHLDALPPGRSMPHAILTLERMLELWSGYPV